MLGRTYENENCSAARALEVVGERWSLLIVRDAMFRGTTKFSEFQRNLGLAPRATDRLHARRLRRPHLPRIRLLDLRRGPQARRDQGAAGAGLETRGLSEGAVPTARAARSGAGEIDAMMLLRQGGPH